MLVAGAPCAAAAAAAAAPALDKAAGGPSDVGGPTGDLAAATPTSGLGSSFLASLCLSSFSSFFLGAPRPIILRCDVVLLGALLHVRLSRILLCVSLASLGRGAFLAASAACTEGHLHHLSRQDHDDSDGDAFCSLGQMSKQVGIVRFSFLRGKPVTDTEHFRAVKRVRRDV